jgi:hypothetical protein
MIIDLADLAGGFIIRINRLHHIVGIRNGLDQVGAGIIGSFKRSKENRLWNGHRRRA